MPHTPLKPFFKKGWIQKAFKQFIGRSTSEAMLASRSFAILLFIQKLLRFQGNFLEKFFGRVWDGVPIKSTHSSIPKSFAALVQRIFSISSRERFSRSAAFLNARSSSYINVVMSVSSVSRILGSFDTSP